MHNISQPIVLIIVLSIIFIVGSLWFTHKYYNSRELFMNKNEKEQFSIIGSTLNYYENVEDIFRTKLNFPPMKLSEMKYRDACIDSMLQPHVKPLKFGSHNISFYSFSAIVNDDVHPDRYAVGTFNPNQHIINLVEKVFEEYDITNSVDLNVLFDNDNLKFYGLGWDYGQNHLKVYMMSDNIENWFDWINEYALQELQESDEDIQNMMKNIDSRGLVSITFNSNSKQVVDRKIYLYPTDERPVYMITQSRGIVQQHDIMPFENEDTDTSKFNDFPENVKKLLIFFDDNDINLDTYSVQNDTYTLYF